LIWFAGAVGLFLLAGCRTVPSSHSSRLNSKAGVFEEEDQVPESVTVKQAAAHAHYSAAVIHEMNDEQEDALREYCLAAIGDLDNEGLILEVSRKLMVRKEFEKAAQLVLKATERPGASAALYARLGLLYGQLGKTDASIQASRTAIRKDPTLFGGYQNLVVLYLQQQRPADAMAVLDEAAKQPDDKLGNLIGLIELYKGLGSQFPAFREDSNQKALAVLHRAESFRSLGPEIRLLLADSYNSLGETRKAADLYLEVLANLPDVPGLRERIHAKLAEIYLKNDDPKRAEEQLQGLIREDPTNPLPYFYLGGIQSESKRLDQAVDNFRKCILLNPRFERVYYSLANAQLSLDRPSDALATLAEARKLFSSNFLLEFLSGAAFSRQKAYDQAIQHYTAAEVLARANDQSVLTHYFYFQMGAAYERKGDIDQAVKTLEKCLKLSPDFAPALNYLGYMWAERGVRLDEARQMIEKALKADPKNSAYLDSLGWVLFRQNHPQEALATLLESVKLLEEPDATVYDHIGDVYQSMNQPEKAREYWKKSLEIEANDAVRKKLDEAK
jgi:tetratricopeptide (TPR) repeat protein